LIAIVLLFSSFYLNGATADLLNEAPQGVSEQNNNDISIVKDNEDGTYTFALSLDLDQNQDFVLRYTGEEMDGNIFDSGISDELLRLQDSGEFDGKFEMKDFPEVISGEATGDEPEFKNSRPFSIEDGSGVITLELIGGNRDQGDLVLENGAGEELARLSEIEPLLLDSEETDASEEATEEPLEEAPQEDESEPVTASTADGNDNIRIVKDNGDGSYTFAISLDLDQNHDFALYFTGEGHFGEMMGSGLVYAAGKLQGVSLDLHDATADQAVSEDNRRPFTVTEGMGVITLEVAGGSTVQGDLVLENGEGEELVRLKDIKPLKSPVAEISLPPNTSKTEKEFRNQDEITTAEMEAYLDGRFASARSGNRITGDMTEAQYKESYAELNAEQNEAWNAKFNFRPETNVRRVANWTEFRDAFTDNTVSKIVLTGNVLTTTSTAIRRADSLEIDGQGFLIDMRNGSINVDGIANLTSFRNNHGRFSDVPVFHMHNVQVRTNNSAGDLEGSLANSWSFVNGQNQWGGGGSALGNAIGNVHRGLWQYRIGNIYTPRGAEGTGTALGSGNQLVGGRLINARHGQVSVWGYNDIVTGAENFYTGGMEFEPYSFYKGMIAAYDYSAIWFESNTSTSPTRETTGSRKFEVGEGSFVYLRHRNSNYTNYPAVYNFWDEMRIGKNSTYNANMAGSAVYFNVNNAQFIAEEGSLVNLLSRRSGNETLKIGPNFSINSSASNPSNCRVEFKPGSSVFIVGNNNGGVVNYASSNGGHEIKLDSPLSFDIRNQSTSGTLANRAFLGNSGSGTGNFIIENSDISIWNTSANMDGRATHDYQNVERFSVARTSNTAVSTDSTLQSDFARNGYRRISGQNAPPELIWVPVTDADLEQRSTILLGYVPIGGSDPFDEHGNARMRPVYADDSVKGYVSYVDTLGNMYTGESDSDFLVRWRKEDHDIPGFQIAGKEMSGVPFRATNVGGVLTPYRTGEVALTTVIDITPPEPAKLTVDQITNATKQITGLVNSTEVGAQIYVDITSGGSTTRHDAGKVDGEGNWQFNFPGYLNAGDIVTIYLEDHVGDAPDLNHPLNLPGDTSPPAPSTNSLIGANQFGNINPSERLPYRDAVFEPAAKFTVVDVLPDKPEATKTVVSNSPDGKTYTGDTLTYTITAKNGKAPSFDTNWANVVITDTIPDELQFDPETANLKLNGETLAEEFYTFDEATRLLTVQVGDLKSDETAVITFETKVSSAAVGKTITNTAKASGESPREEEPFVPGPEDPNKPKQVYEAEASVNNPGGEVLPGGDLQITRYPDLDFGSSNKASALEYGKEYSATYSDDLEVADSRVRKTAWTMSVALSKDFEEVTNNALLLHNVLFFRNAAGIELPIHGTNTLIYDHELNSSIELDTVTISDAWTNPTGFFLRNNGIKKGAYLGEVTWTLTATPSE